jgi:hypothetical protein
MMKLAIKMIFAGTAAVLYALTTFTVLYKAIYIPNFSPNDAHTFLMDAIGAAIITFIAAQLGIAVSGEGNKSFGKRVGNAMGKEDSKLAKILLGADVAIILLAGIGFVLLWVNPALIALPEGSNRLTEAPDYVATHAKAFVGIILAALAGLAPNTKT